MRETERGIGRGVAMGAVVAGLVTAGALATAATPALAGDGQPGSTAGNEAVTDTYVLKTGSTATATEPTAESPLEKSVSSMNTTVTLYLWKNGAYTKDASLAEHMTYVSSDEEIATVSPQSGYNPKVTFAKQKGGTVYITALYDGQEVAKGYINFAYEKMTGFAIDDLTLFVGDSIAPKNFARFTPENASITGLDCEIIDNPDNAVSKGFFGTLVASNPGTATIKAKSSTYDDVPEVTFKITVSSELPFKIGDTEYRKLKDAIDAVPDDTENPVVIKVMHDMTSTPITNGGIKVPAHKNVLIDFQGHTYQTIPDVGSDGTATQVVHVASGGKLTLKNGTLKAYGIQTNGYHNRMFMQNYGDIVIEDMTLDATMLNGPTAPEAQINFNSGSSVVRGESTVILPEGKNVTVNLGGNESWYAGGAMLDIETLTIVDGGLRVVNGTADVDTAKLTIAGGEIGTVDYGSALPSLVSVSGGTFSAPVPEQYCAPGFQPVTEPNADGKYEVGSVFIDVNRETFHSGDIAWLAGNGISGGWDNTDGTKSFKPLAKVTRCDMAAFLFRLAKNWGVVDESWSASDEVKATFSDVDESTFHAREVWWLASEGISGGWDVAGGKKEFRPNATVKRQDMAAFLFRLAKKAGRGGAVEGWVPAGDDTKSKFKDISATAADNHHDEVWWLAENKVSEGWDMGDGTFEFRGLNDIARCDMAAFLHRMDGLPVTNIGNEE